MSTVYLRRDLKSFAREAACANSQPLSRYIESLLIGELAAANFPVASRAAWACTLDIRSPKDAAPDHP